MLSQKRNFQIFSRAEVKDLAGEVGVTESNAVEIRLVQACAGSGAGLFKNLLDARLAAVDHRVAALDDAGLGGGDLLQGIAQHLSVVEADVADDGSLRRGDDVRGVQLAAESDLQRDDLAVMAHEVFHGDGRDQLELRRMILHRLGVRPDELGDLCQLLIGDHLAVHLHPLIEAEDEGRGVKPRAVARGAEYGGQHGGSGALAVGAGDVDEFQLVLRVSDALKQFAGAGQTRHGALPAHGMNVAQRFRIGHDFTFFGIRIVCCTPASTGRVTSAISTDAAAPSRSRSQNTPKISS